MKKENEAIQYINPELSEEQRKKGNECFEKGDFPGAVKEYTEGLRRDPKNKSIYSNRAAAYIKLMEFAFALNDIEIQMLLKDPRIVQVLKDLQENPQSAQGALRDPFIGEGINKLIAAGIVKMA